MKLSDLRNIRVDRLSNEEIENIHTFLKRTYNRSLSQFRQRGLNPEPLRKSQERLSEIPSNLTGISRQQAEIAAMRKFYFTTPPGSLSEQRAKTSTVVGYINVLKKTGKILGIDNYATNEWTEDQRTELWRKIDKVRELGADRFLPNGFGNLLYQSGRNLKTVTVIIKDLGESDPVEILDLLDQRIEAVENGNRMTDREFYGI